MHKKHTIKIRRATFLGLLFFVVLGFLIINNNHAQAALLNQYNKINGGTLQASEWNNLLADFVTKNNGGDRLDGFYSINTATSSAYVLDINGALRATSITGALSGTLSSANVSAGLFGDNTGGGNYNFPANIGIGIGTTTPLSIITLANDRWVSARNSAGNGYVNIFKVNANDEIEIGGALNIGNFQFPADSGFNTFVDMPVTSASPNDSIQGYVMKIDGDNILSVFSQSDGLGGIKNRRIGINTSTPQFDLDVNGIINASALYVNGAPYIGSQWTTNGTSIYYNTGNVGIGTTDPGAKLQISGGSADWNETTPGTTKGSLHLDPNNSATHFGNAITFASSDNSNAQAGIYVRGDGGYGTKMYLATTDSYATGARTRMMIDYNGNVGIGTTSPQALLDVNGLIKMRSSTITANEDVVNKGYLDSALASTTAGIITQVATSSFWQGSLTGNVYNANTGNVGIGTTNPLRKMHIEVNDTTNELLFLNASYDLYSDIVQADTGGSIRLRESSGAYEIFTGGSANSHSASGSVKRLTIGSTGDFAFNTNQLFVNASSGNVGIGTTNPGHKLDVKGATNVGISVSSSDNADNPYIQLAGDGGNITTEGMKIYYVDSQPNTFFDSMFNNDSYGFRFRTKVSGTPVNALTILGSGNVGIGTTTPGTRLTVVGSGNYSIDAGNYRIGNVAPPSSPLDAVNLSYLESTFDTIVGDNVGSGISGQTLRHDGTSWVANSLLFNDGTNIGVGTTNPGFKVEVSNSIGSSNYNGLRISDTGWTAYSYPTLDFYNSNASYNSSIARIFAFIGAGGTSPALQFNVADASKVLQPRMAINSAGNVGIGTINPTKKLVVNNTGSTNVLGSMEFGNDNNAYTSLKVLSDGVGFTLKGHTSGGGYISANAALNFSNNDSVNAGTLWLGNGNRLRLVDSTGTTNYLVVNTTGNVGIGTTTPDSRLSVSGGNIFINDAAITSGTPKAAITKEYLTSTLDAFNSETNLWKLNGSTLYSSSTDWNVGIGVNSASYPLVVHSDTAGTVAEFRNSVGNVAYINITDNSTGSGTSNGLTLGYNGQAMIHNRENTPMVFSTNDTGRMRIAASGGVSIGSTYVSNDPGTSSLIVEGNLGLGTTNPTTKLDVEGVIRTTTGIIAPLTTGDALYSSAGNNDVNIWKISNAGNSYGFYQKYVGTGSGDANALELWTTGEVNNDLLVYHLRQSGNMGFGTTNPSTAKIVIATSTNGYTLDAGNFKIGNVATPTFNLDAANKSYVDSTIAAATSSITLWGGTTSGNVWSLNSGNVGIGTTSPEAKLHVAGDIKLDNNKSIYGTLSSGGNRELLKYDASNDIYVGAGTANNVYVGNNANRIQMKVSGDDFMSFTTNSAEVMRINHLGNVGIGTPSPNSKLHVYSTSPNAEIDIQSVVGAGNHWGLYNEISNNSLKLWGGADHLTVLRDGKVGIGTTAPEEKLHIIGNILGASSASDTTTQSFIIGQKHYNNSIGDFSWLSGISSSAQNLLYIGGGATGYSGAEGIRFYTTSDHTTTTTSEKMRIESNGNVGIGTTNPGAYKLYVNGDTNINGILTANSVVGPVTGTVVAGNVTSGEFGSNGSGGNYIFSVANPLGNIGIGVAVPLAKFHAVAINGTNNSSYNFILDNQDVTGTQGSGLLVKGGANSVGSNTFAVQDYSGNTDFIVRGDGNVGIGTTNPAGRFDVQDGTGTQTAGDLVVDAVSHIIYVGQLDAASGNTSFIFRDRLGNVKSRWNNAGAGSIGFGNFGTNYGVKIQSPAVSSLSTTTALFEVNGQGYSGTLASFMNGNVGIGTTDPGVYRLKVAGDVAITGTLQTQTGSDFAEEFSVLSDLESGTVVTMAEEGYKSVRAANKAYDSQVVGIVSDNPSIIAGRVESEKKVVVAMMGVVSVKVSDINGEVRKGDLLTSSSISGYAMKAVDYKPGTIIGKALEDLTGKSGSIKVLVNLQ